MTPSILDVAQDLGLQLRGSGAKRTLVCPLRGHDDTRASAVIFLEPGRFHCSVCTPGRSLSAAELAGATGHSSGKTPGWHNRAFTPDDARSTWALAQARTRDDSSTVRAGDEEVYRYLTRRGLTAAWEQRAFGILARSMKLPCAIAHWPDRGYRLVAPLFEVTSGELVNLQARSIRPESQPKSLFPKGTQARGTVFANGAGWRLLAGETGESPVVLAEGLSDHLALTMHTVLATLSAPGASVAVAAIASWVRDRPLILALDSDRAGDVAAIAVARSAHLAGARSVTRALWPKPAKDACEALELLGTRGFLDLVEAWEKLS